MTAAQAPAQAAPPARVAAATATAAVVPSKWYEKPKVEELLDPCGYGRRIYKVGGANGTYCITIASSRRGGIGWRSGAGTLLA